MTTVAQVGDYVTYQPTIASYTISASLTGYSRNQTIYPSNTTLWRVLELDDLTGKISIVPQESDMVTFKGDTGYLDYESTLSDISKKFIDNKYSSTARHFGNNLSDDALISTVATFGLSDTFYARSKSELSSSTCIDDMGSWGVETYYIGVLDSNGLYWQNIADVVSGCMYADDYEYDESYDYDILPVVELSANLNVSGNGTFAEPYVLK